MKYLYLSSLCIIFGCVVKAQLSIVPQLGIESSRTTVSYNKSPNFSPLGTKFSPQASVRLDYKFKKGHGPFAGLATTRSAVNYSFSNPETGGTIYTASRDNTTLRIEGGYQVSTKPIYFNKSASKNKSNSVAPKTTSSRKSCRDFYTRSSCGSRSYTNAVAQTPGAKGAWMSIQPSAGMAFVPTASAAEIVAPGSGNINSYEYTAGNWKTAAIAGLGFAFGKGGQQKLLVSINYLKGIGNLQTESITTTPDLKPTTTYISSNASNWNLRVGVPFNLAKTKKPATQKEVIIIRQRTETKQPAEVKQPKQEKKCGAYYFRCRKAV
jgi:hypothetical protein